MPYQSGFRPGLFEGQTIFIPGGGGGLGRCIAHELSFLGVRLVLAGRTEDKLQQVRGEVVEDGGIHHGNGSFLFKSENKLTRPAFNGFHRDEKSKLLGDD